MGRTVEALMPLYEMGFSEPCELSGHCFAFEVSGAEVPTDWPVYGIVRAATFDDSIVGHRVEVRPRHVGEANLDDSPVVSVAVEDTDSRWRGIGFGKLHKIKGSPFDDGGEWIERQSRLQHWRTTDPTDLT